MFTYLLTIGPFSLFYFFFLFFFSLEVSLLAELLENAERSIFYFIFSLFPGEVLGECQHCELTTELATVTRESRRVRQKYNESRHYTHPANEGLPSTRPRLG